MHKDYTQYIIAAATAAIIALAFFAGYAFSAWQDTNRPATETVIAEETVESDDDRQYIDDEYLKELAYNSQTNNWDF